MTPVAWQEKNKMDENGLDASLQDLEDFDEIPEDDLRTKLSDEAREEMDKLVGLKTVGLELWEDSLGDDEDEAPVPAEERVVFDCDLFMDESLALELYATVAYPDPEGDPVQGVEKIFEVVGKLADDNLELVDYDEADEEGGLALAFGVGERVQLVLLASGWAVNEWVPDEKAEE
jgi:hypothetical protein